MRGCCRGALGFVALDVNATGQRSEEGRGEKGEEKSFHGSDLRFS
jgi:hypothetical protein